jgi:hypothetical protein
MVKLQVPDAVCQEFCNLVAVLCRKLVFTRKSDGANTATQLELMEKAFHGSPGYASVLDEVLLGKGDYAELYIKHELENNREGNELRTEGNMLELKETFHRVTGKRFIVHERDFEREVFAKYQDVPLKGRNINDRALDVASNYKHALRFYKEYSVANDTPSGMKLEDMLDHVLRKMYVHCKGKKQYASSKEVFEKTEDDMPPKWMFTGFFCFVLFGPKPLSGKTLTSLTEDGRTNIAKKSRKTTREEDKDVKDKEREAGIGGDNVTYNRGVTMADKASAAHMANSSHQFMLKHCRDMLVVLNSEYSLLLKELTKVNAMARNFQGDDDIEQESSEWRKDIKERLDYVRQKKRKIQAEEEELHAQNTNKIQVTAYYEQLGFAKPVAAAKAVVTVDPKTSIDDNSTLTEGTGLVPVTVAAAKKTDFAVTRVKNPSVNNMAVLQELPKPMSLAMAKVYTGSLSMTQTTSHATGGQIEEVADSSDEEFEKV